MDSVPRPSPELAFLQAFSQTTQANRLSLLALSQFAFVAVDELVVHRTIRTDNLFFH